MKKKIAIYAGSFDPFHEGHLLVAKKASKLFDKLIIVISVNNNKKCNNSFEERFKIIKSQIKDLSNVVVKINKVNLTVDFAIMNGAKYLVRGLRNENDLKYELEMADVNNKLNNEITTIFFASDIETRKISSSIINEIKRYK